MVCEDEVTVNILISGKVLREKFVCMSSISNVFERIQEHVDAKITENDLFIPTSGIWMIPTRSLSSYNIQNLVWFLLFCLNSSFLMKYTGKY